MSKVDAKLAQSFKRLPRDFNSGVVLSYERRDMRFTSSIYEANCLCDVFGGKVVFVFNALSTGVYRY